MAIKIVTWGDISASTPSNIEKSMQYGVSVNGAHVVERVGDKLVPFLRKDRKEALAKRRELVKRLSTAG